MYYSVLIDFIVSVGKKATKRQFVLTDELNLDNIKSHYVVPYLTGDYFIVNGYRINRDVIERFKIVSTEQSVKEIVQYKQASLHSGVFFTYTPAMIIGGTENVKDITDELLISNTESAKNQTNGLMEVSSLSCKPDNKVFIVHGHDDTMKNDVANYLIKLKLEPVILHEQANLGMTLIEKIEEYSNVGFGIVLYTPCDKGGLATDDIECMKFRARQNVVFEHGYLLGKLGRSRVCALMKGELEYPNDISGLLYIEYQPHGAWQFELAREMKKVGLPMDINQLLDA